MRGIDILRKNRIFLLSYVKDLSVEEMNKVPEGFNNNIIWNLAHLVASEQGVCYIRAGLKTVVEEQFFLTFKPGTKPESFVEAKEIEQIKELLLSSLDQLEKDYSNKIFTGYTPWVTRYGVEINNIDEAIGFLPFHEGMHIGIIMALRKVVKR